MAKDSYIHSNWLRTKKGMDWDTNLPGGQKENDRREKGKKTWLSWEAMN